MEHNEKIKQLVSDVLGDELALYDVAWHQEGKNKILQIAIMRKDGTMDIDTCAEVSEKISAKLDEEDFIQSEYFLEVCSPGAERELKTYEQIKDAIGEFVYVKLKDPKAGMCDVKGTLLSCEENSILIQYMDKAVKKKAEIEIANIALIRLSVKI